MKVRLVIVPPGGGEADYALDFEMSGVPQSGDYITVSRPGQVGTEDFIVRRTWWFLDFPSLAVAQSGDNPTYGSVKSIAVECEIARGPYSSEEHSKTCDAYEKRGTLQTFEETAF